VGGLGGGGDWVDVGKVRDFVVNDGKGKGFHELNGCNYTVLNLETCKTNISYLAAQRNLTWTEGEE